jgi:glyoxylase-like metal-dependent hydrolase (beta-lactamase superfamily II)
MRCLLIEDGKRLILIDNGMGDKQDAKFFGYYFLHGNDSLKASLAKYGFTTDDITDVVLTHLHFDHCGGSIVYNSDRTKLSPAFKNAKYWCHPKHWEWAVNPNPREKASFLKENILPIQESGQLNWLTEDTQLIPSMNFVVVNGHTESMVLPLIQYNNQTILFMADLIPSVGHLPIPYVMGYDVRPMDTLKEKTELLNKAVNTNWLLFFEHDPLIELISLEQTERGIRKKENLVISEL